MDQQYDVIIIGAGAAGLIAALEIALTRRSVAVIEAKEGCGGRINTIYTKNGYPIEQGAEFVHGNLPITQELAKKAGTKMYEVSGSIWQKKGGELNEQKDFIEDFSALQKKFKELKDDIPFAEFLNAHLQGDEYEELRFTLQNYVEGYYAADINKASTFALREELTKGDDEQYRIEDGYQKLVVYLETACRKQDVAFYFLQPVWQLHWKKGGIEAITEQGSFKAAKAIITVSVGVLQTGGITFSPVLPQKKEAAVQLGFGHVIKINFWFDEPFWKNKKFTGHKNLKDLNFLFSEEKIPTWWTRHPKNEPVITGWLGGPKAKAFSTLNKPEIVQKALLSLSNIFTIAIEELTQELKMAYLYNWSADAYFNGAYSFAVMNGGDHIKQLLEPVEDTIYFAGEGLHQGKEIGTVEAAFQSGRTVAQQLIASFS